MIYFRRLKSITSGRLDHNAFLPDAFAAFQRLLAAAAILARHAALIALVLILAFTGFFTFDQRNF